ncbi:Metal-pseudopaline receptor CntO [Methylobacterium adhaesivum]|uniref:TonB-dependent siderophore receptor n=1 Tax=Methylobacterium adhaesivum TaxID=333297 RepID=A0ABT8BL08_9HYPH|nr:TonB-dependent siderophore receptor [Methylobacterium adhaesivum]MDN3592893.1 TonB-dependent siderophore receptor [Methylobacterium adhaesivum]GJD31674.1 Metal-pseudopaline receptor CntO [Methylobacterium adhaesivum]
MPSRSNSVRSSLRSGHGALGAGLLLALVPRFATAQDSAVTLETLSVAGSGVAPVGLNLRTVDRGASRLGLTPLETPASVDVIAGETARRRGQNTVVEAVTENATGITTVASPGNGNGAFTARGFAGPNSIQQLYDGTRLYVGAGTVTFPFDTWNVERIEVLRGPASVLYGDGAIGGVVNVVTKKPVFTPINEARAALGSDGLARLALDSGGPIGEALAYRFNISGNRSSGWMQPEGDFRNLAVSGALTLQATPDLAFTLSHDLGYQEPARYWGTPLVDGRILESIRFNNYNVRDAKIVWTDNWTQLKTEWNPSADITVRNTAYRLQSRRQWLDVEQYAFNRSTGRIDRSDYIEIYHQQEQVGNRLDATVRGSVFGFRNEFLAGFDVNHIAFRHTNNFSSEGANLVTSVDPFVYDPGLFPANGRASPAYATSTNQASVFAENRLILTDQLSLLTGARFDAPTLNRRNLVTGATFDRDFQALSYRFGAVYAPNPDLSLYAQYATATDPVGSLITLSQSLANFRLSTGEQVEIGAKGIAFGGLAEWTLAGYRIVKDNLISTVPGQPTVSTQVGRQSSLGIEAAISLHLFEAWRVDANVALLHAQYDDFNQTVAGAVVSYAGRQPMDVPERVANLWVNWTFAPAWEARIGVQYVGETFSDFGNTARRPDYTLLNAGLDYQVGPASRLSLRAYNLADTVYAISGNAVNGVGTNWLLGRPRSFEVAYAVSF